MSRRGEKFTGRAWRADRTVAERLARAALYDTARDRRLPRIDDDDSTAGAIVILHAGGWEPKVIADRLNIRSATVQQVIDASRERERVMAERRVAARRIAARALEEATPYARSPRVEMVAELTAAG